mmetsp:Transcript_12270/g.20372  ORF Transcript_12270/g.20372 Transcript_12270/m.20372 type:complete len:350 (+) Transcript_12270:66-1115(+)
MINLVKLVTFSCKQNMTKRVGLMAPSQQIVDLANTGKFHAALPTVAQDMQSFIAACNADKEILPLLQSLLEMDTFEQDPAVQNVVQPQLHAPIVPTRNLMCVGKNYLDHVAEVAAARGSFNLDGSDTPRQELQLPSHAIFFTKPPQCVVATGAKVESHPTLTKMLDYEAELAVVIGTAGRDISEEDAMSHVFGYTVGNDVTARDLQKKHTQWFKGKSLDTSCPLGPCIVPRFPAESGYNSDDLVSSVDCGSDASSGGVLPSGSSGPNWAIRCWINGELRQSSRTNNMIFTIPKIIAQLSQGFTLQPGDVILTGTPEGVGFAMKPPQPLKTGDLMEIEIENIGRLVNSVV